MSGTFPINFSQMYIPPSMPDFNSYGFGVPNFMTPNFSNFSYSGAGSMSDSFQPSQTSQTSQSTSSSSSEKMSIHEKIEQAKLLMQKEREIKEAIKPYDEQLESIKSNKKEDGSAVLAPTKDEYKKLPWYKKAFRAVANMGQGIWKTCEGFVGYEDGKMNWKKCFTNLGIAAGCVAATFIPVAGPFISAALLTAGVATGAYGAGKGIYKACKAETAKEMDEAFQDIGSGTFIGATSAMGLRGLGKGFRLQNPNGTMFASQPSVAATRSGLIGKGVNTVSQFAKDATVNAFRATVDASRTDILAMEFAGGGLKGFAKAAKSKAVESWNKCPSKEKFESAKDNAMKDLNTKITDLDTKIANASSRQEKALLKLEKSGLEKTRTQLETASSKQEWTQIKNESASSKFRESLKETSSKFSENGSVKINGVRFKAEDKQLLNNYISRLSKEHKALSKQLDNLYRLRLKSMNNMAYKHSAYKSDLDAYVGEQKNLFAYKKAINEGRVKEFFNWKSPFKAGMQVLDMPFKPYRAVSKSAGSSEYKLRQVLGAEYVNYMFDSTLTPEEVEQGIAQLETEKQALEGQLKEIEKLYA